jgi:hypothetical protein
MVKRRPVVASKYSGLAKGGHSGETAGEGEQ